MSLVGTLAVSPQVEPGGWAIKQRRGVPPWNRSKWDWELGSCRADEGMTGTIRSQSQGMRPGARAVRMEMEEGHIYIYLGKKVFSDCLALGDKERAQCLPGSWPP